MTWLVLSNIECACGFAVVAHLALIPYYFLNRSFLNALPRNSFPRSYIIIVGRGYLHNHVFSTSFFIVAAYLLLYYTISKHTIDRSIMFKAFSMRGLSWTSLLILYRSIRSTNNLFHGMASASLAGNLPYLKLCFLFFWQVLQTFMWVHILSLKLGH